MTHPANWSDLAPRVLSGLVMAGAGAALVMAGGWIFAVAVWALGGLMIRELMRMSQTAQAATGPAILAPVALAMASVVPTALVAPLLVAAALVGAARAGRDRGIVAAFAVGVLFACHAIVLLRWQAGPVWVLWLVAVVVVSDIAGYFAGRSLGGPKFWPRISPKKTWSGTLAGWAGAALVGAAFAAPTGAGPVLIAVSVLVSFAGQMGDIAESAVKRRFGVKDSSALIPGHGGVLDRFDALLGATLLAAALLWLAGAGWGAA